MIPSRGIARSIPAGMPRGLAGSRLSGRTFATQSLQSSRQTPQYSGLLSSHGTRAKLFAAGTGAGPMALGSVASSRNLSLWGWGGSKTTIPSTETTTTTATQFVQDQQDQQVASSATETFTNHTVYASVPPPAPAPTSMPLTEPPVTATELDTDGLFDMITGQDILDLPADTIGYLESLGLEHGYPGFSYVMQWVLEHIHVYSGWGWGTSIIATAFALRGAMFVPHIFAMQSGARMARMQADERSKEMIRVSKEAMAKGGDAELSQRSAYLRKMLKEEYGVKNTSFMWSFLQIPFTFGLFNVIRQMSAIPVPGLESAGFLWFIDLTVRDPYFILPAVATSLMVASMSLGRKYMAEQQRKMMKPMVYAMGGIGFTVTTFLSSGVNLMGVAFGASTLLTSLILEIPFLRRKLGLAMGPPDAIPVEDATDKPAAATSINGVQYHAPRVLAGKTTASSAVANAAAAEVDNPAPKSIRERLTSSLNDAREGMSTQLGTMGGRFATSEADKAERNRKDLIKKLEKTRQEQEREQFAKKYKKSQ